MDNIISKIKKANIVGRGGACFPTALKWESVKKSDGEKKYVVCNVSEGEPGVLKDKYVLENYLLEAIEGIKIAIEYIGAERAYFYINPNYYTEYQYKLRKIIKDAPITIFKKDHSAGYIGGEETSALNHIEGEKVEPRLRPPFPTTNGLWGYPTLVNNLETFLDVALVVSDKYKGIQFFTINGDCLNRGVYELSRKLTISDILKETNNYPSFDFFVQVNGDAGGEVLDCTQLDIPVNGRASITVYSKLKHEPIDLIRKWAAFFQKESCGQCTPCREGLIRLNEELNSNEPDWEMCGDILNNLSETSFCGLGLVASVAIKSYAKNVLAISPGNEIIFSKASNEFVCSCLTSKTIK